MTEPDTDARGETARSGREGASACTVRDDRVNVNSTGRRCASAISIAGYPKCESPGNVAPPRTRCDSANARAQASDFLTVNEKPAAVGYRAIENGDYVVRRAAALSWAHAGTRVSLPPGLN